MKILQNSFSGKVKEMSIADAIDGSTDNPLSEGTLETAKDKADRTAQMLGQLVQFLHESGALRDEQVAAMLAYRYTVEDCLND